MKPRGVHAPGGAGQVNAGPEVPSGGGECRPGVEDESCGAVPSPPGAGPEGGAGGTGPGLPDGDVQAGGEQSHTEFAAPDLPTALPSPTPGQEGAVLPPVTAPEQGQSGAGENQMTLMSPTAMSERDETDWAIVVGIALVAEIGLLWGAACVGLVRRRMALYREASRAMKAAS